MAERQSYLGVPLSEHLEVETTHGEACTPGKIAVEEAIVSEERMGKHVTYAVRGYDSVGRFEAFRRYSDFCVLRSYMRSKWLGLYIPGVPPKKVLVSPTQGAMKPSAIESRRKLLHSFCTVVSQIDYLYRSEEFQVFIRGRDSFDKECTRLPTPSIPQTRKEYQALFESEPEITDFQPISEFEVSLNSSVNQAKYLKVKLKSLVQYHKGLEDAQHKLAEAVRTFEATVYTQYAENPIYRVVATGVSEEPSPFQVLRDWAAWEYVEGKSMLEGIQTRNTLLSQQEKTQHKRIEIKKHLSKRQRGKKSIFTLKKQKNVEEIEMELQEIERELADLAVICTLSERWLVRHQIPLFKLHRSEAYLAAMRVFSREMVPDAGVLVKCFASMSEFV